MDQSRAPGCLCTAEGTNPICPADDHRTAPTPEWLRRARARELPAYAVGGVPLLGFAVAPAESRREREPDLFWPDGEPVEGGLRIG